MFINSEPPQFRKARKLAVEIQNFEAAFLTHTSYVDTTKLQYDIPQRLIDAALREEGRKHGQLAPFVRDRIVEGVAVHEAMQENHRAKVLEG